MPATKQKRAQGEESRARLLEAAAYLVGGGGYAGTSVDAIAKHAGVVKSALYWHFGSKHGLLMAALEDYTVTWVASLEEAVADTRDPFRRLDELLRWVRELIVARSDKRRMVFSLLLEMSGREAALQERLAELFTRMRSSLTEGFVEVVPVPAERLYVICDVLVCTLDGILLNFLATRDPVRLDAALAEVRRTVLMRIAHETQKYNIKKRVDAAAAKKAAEAG